MQSWSMLYSAESTLRRSTFHFLPRNNRHKDDRVYICKLYNLNETGKEFFSIDMQSVYMYYKQIWWKWVEQSLYKTE